MNVSGAAVSNGACASGAFCAVEAGFSRQAERGKSGAAGNGAARIGVPASGAAGNAAIGNAALHTHDHAVARGQLHILVTAPHA
jgi:hypothetical protein